MADKPTRTEIYRPVIIAPLQHFPQRPVNLQAKTTCLGSRSLRLPMGKPNACDRLYPAGPRNSDSRWTHCALQEQVDLGSSQGTSNNQLVAIPRQHQERPC